MPDVRAACTSLGISEVHTEPFGPANAVNPGVVGRAHVIPHPPSRPPGSGPLVTFARSGLTVRSDGSGAETLLELADACDVPTRWSCQTGVCHTCVTALLSGEVTYDPAPLEAPAAGSVLICCARADSELVLDM